MTTEIRERLFALRDLKYREFSVKLIPTVSPEKIIGVRTPELKRLVNELKNRDDISEFLTLLPHRYYEENNLHGFLICEIKDFNRSVKEINRFLPFVDNWATCDGLRPKAFNENTEKLLPQIEEWLSNAHTYTVRFGILMLMNYFLDEHFNAKQHELITEIKSNEYYINMMVAWYFATALAKQWESTIPFIEKMRLPLWVHNKTIQKAVESHRLTKEQKEYLKAFRKGRYDNTK